MTQPDPWATAANKTQGQNSQEQGKTAGASTQGVAANPVTDTANPFATAAEVTPQGGGQFDPFVPNAYLEGRMLVMVPKRFTDTDPKPESMGGGLRDKWTVDVVILDGDPFTFTYKTKESREATEYVEKEMTVDSFPATFRGQSIWGGQLIAALNGANKEGKFIYGVFTKVPTKQDERAGKTIESVNAEIAQWRKDIADGKPGVSSNMPRHTYNLDSRPEVLTQDRINRAMAWWEQEKASRLNTAS